MLGPDVDKAAELRRLELLFTDGGFEVMGEIGLQCQGMSPIALLQANNRVYVDAAGLIRSYPIEIVDYRLGGLARRLLSASVHTSAACTLAPDLLRKSGLASFSAPL